MKNNYLEKLTALLKQVHPKFFTAHHLEFKNVFGAVGGYFDGRIFISYGKFGVAFKLPQETLGDLFKERGVKHLKYFSKGQVKKEYAVVPLWILKDKRQFKKLVDRSLQFVAQ